MSSLPVLRSCLLWTAPQRRERRAAIYRAKLLPTVALICLLCLPVVAGPLKGAPASSVKDGSDTPIKIDLSYVTSTPPLEVTFNVAGGHYSGAVTGGNLFLETDIPDAPLVRFSQAKPGSFSRRKHPPRDLGRPGLAGAIASGCPRHTIVAGSTSAEAVPMERRKCRRPAPRAALCRGALPD